jgi:hypothetical protein
MFLWLRAAPRSIGAAGGAEVDRLAERRNGEERS